MKKLEKKQERSKRAVIGKSRLPDVAELHGRLDVMRTAVKGRIEKVEHKADVLMHNGAMQEAACAALSDRVLKLEATLDAMSKGAESRLKALEHAHAGHGHELDRLAKKSAAREPADAQSALYDARIGWEKSKATILEVQRELSDCEAENRRFKEKILELEKKLAAKGSNWEPGSIRAEASAKGDAYPSLSVLDQACALLVEAKNVLSVFPKHGRAAEMVDKIIGFLEKT